MESLNVPKVIKWLIRSHDSIIEQYKTLDLKSEHSFIWTRVHQANINHCLVKI